MGLGIDIGRFRVDPHKNYMAVSINWRSFFWCAYNKNPAIWRLC